MSLLGGRGDGGPSFLCESHIVRLRVAPVFLHVYEKFLLWHSVLLVAIYLTAVMFSICCALLAHV